MPGDSDAIRKETLLDVGCGNGFFLKFLQKCGWDTQGIEVSEAATRIGREEFGLNIFNGSLEEAEFQDNSFDIVNLSHFLEHVYDPVATLRETRRVVKDDRLIIVSVQNIDSANFRLFRSRWCGHDLPRHMYDFTPATFKKLIEKIENLEVYEIKFMSSPIVLFYSILYELRHRRMNWLKPLAILMIPLQFLYCFVLAIAHRSDLMTGYLRKIR